MVEGSLPAETEFAAMFVPSCAREKAKAMKKTPARVPCPPSSRKRDSKSRGLQIVSLNITVDDEDTMMPMKEVTAKPIGIVKNCDHKASVGFFANREKSGSFLIIRKCIHVSNSFPEGRFETLTQLRWQSLR